MAEKNIIGIFNFTNKGGGTVGSGYEVLECEFGFAQTFDKTNKPSGLPEIKIIKIKIKASNDTTFIDWMVTPNAEKSGLIEIKISENKSRKISFKRAFCVNYSEHFNFFSERSAFFSAGILSKDITVNDVEYSIEWDNK